MKPDPLLSVALINHFGHFSTQISELLWHLKFDLEFGFPLRKVSNKRKCNTFISIFQRTNSGDVTIGYHIEVLILYVIQFFYIIINYQCSSFALSKHNSSTAHALSPCLKMTVVLIVRLCNMHACISTTTGLSRSTLK